MIRLCFTLLLLSGPIFAQTQDSHLERGVDLLRQQQFAEALPEFEQAQHTHPNVPDIDNLLGIILTQLNRLPEADQHYRKAIALDPRLAGPHKNLGFNELNEKHYAEAERELKRALSLDASDAFTHYYLATLYLSTGKDAEAVEELSSSEALLANDPDTQFLMAKACLHTGHMPEALKLIQSLVGESKLTKEENYDLAVLLASEHLYPESVQRFEFALAADPQSWIAQYDLAIAELYAGQTEKALALLKPLAAAQSDNPAILSFLGSAYESSNQLPSALDAYKRAVEADPQNPDRYLDYTRLLMDLDRTDEASKLVEQGISSADATEDPYALDLRLGVLRLKQARFDEARSAFNQAIALHPELVLGYVAQAQSYMQQGSDEDAMEWLLKARSKLPQDATLEYYFGLVSLRLGRLPEAEAALKNSARLQPDVVESHSQLGKLYSQTDRFTEAKVEFERVIALSPLNSNAHYQLSKIYARLGDTKKAAEMADAARGLMQAQREAGLARQKSRSAPFQPTDTK